MAPWQQCAGGGVAAAQFFLRRSRRLFVWLAPHMYMIMACACAVHEHDMSHVHVHVHVRAVMCCRPTGVVAGVVLYSCLPHGACRCKGCGSISRRFRSVPSASARGTPRASVGARPIAAARTACAT